VRLARAVTGLAADADLGLLRRIGAGRRAVVPGDAGGKLSLKRESTKHLSPKKSYSHRFGVGK
jgi:hypothetical protein